MSSLVALASVKPDPRVDNANTGAVDPPPPGNAATPSGDALANDSLTAPPLPQPLPPLTTNLAFIQAQKGIHVYILAEPHAEADGAWDVSAANEWIQNQPVSKQNRNITQQLLILVQ
jgi:hypothetical protein